MNPAYYTGPITYSNMTPAQPQFWQVTLDSEFAEYRRHCWQDTDCVSTREKYSGVNVNGVIIPLDATNNAGILETTDGISEVFFQESPFVPSSLTPHICQLAHRAILPK